MKTVLAKYNIQDLVNSGYTGAVLVPVTDDLDDMPPGELAAILSWSEKAIRTIKQNSSLHKYFTQLSEKLNASGWDMKATLEKLSKNTKIPWSPHAVKERLWAPVQLDTYGTDSTTKLDTDQVTGVYEALNVVTGERLGVSLPFPSIYSLMDQQLERK